jgi:hypothetical protein
MAEVSCEDYWLADDFLCGSDGAREAWQDIKSLTHTYRFRSIASSFDECIAPKPRLSANIEYLFRNRIGPRNSYLSFTGLSTRIQQPIR